MSEMNETPIEEMEEGNADDIFGMIGTSVSELKTDKPKVPAKKQEAPKKTAEKATEKPKTGKTYKYPFQVYFAGKTHDLTGLLEDGKEYSESQVTNVMLAQHFYEFSGAVSYDYIKETNTLVAMFVQHKKG